MATTTMTMAATITTPGPILLPPTPPQTPPLEAKRSSSSFSPISSDAFYSDDNLPTLPLPAAKTTHLPLSSALGLPSPKLTTFAFEKPPPPPAKLTLSRLAVSSRLSELGWKSRPRQGPQGDCRQLQKPNRSLQVPTLLPGGVPAVVLHGPKCECREREETTEKAGDDELVARVLALAQRTAVRQRLEQQRRMREEQRRAAEKRERSLERKGKRGGMICGWRVGIPKEVTRFFSSRTSSVSLSDSSSDSDSDPESTTVTGSTSMGLGFDQDKITDLCLACSNLDIDKIVTHLFTNKVPINGRCTVTTSAEVPLDSQPVETTPLFSVLRSPLFSTRPKGQTAILRLLLDLGADPNASVSVLTLSSEFESTHVPAQTQPGRLTILSAASILGLPEAVSLLLERGAKVDARKTSLPLGVDGKWGKGLSALDVATMAGQDRVVEILLRAGALVTGTCDLFLPAQLPINKFAGGRPKLRSASTSNLLSAKPSQSQLLQVPTSEPQWPTPLPIQRKTTRLSGVTPLHLASLSGNLSIAAMILSSSNTKTASDLTNARTSTTNNNMTTGGRTPLHYAAESLNLELSSLLLSDPRTDPDATDDDGATPLALLVGKLESTFSMRQQEEVVELVRRLLRAGANAGVVRCGTELLSLKARLLALDDGRENSRENGRRWGDLFEEDARGVLRGSVKRRY
ncbi:ankyrin repeat-containing domain protein [Neurospora crassa]|nr:ankyrin repeat-containing domain protein [Neurospora crassa]